MAYMTRPEEAVLAIVDLLQGSNLDIQYIGRFNEKRLPEYPAVVVVPGIYEKELHATHTFNILLRCVIWVFHARLDSSSGERSLEDLQLCTQIEEVLEADLTFGNTLIHSFVESEEPGISQPLSNKSPAVKSTRMAWVGMSQRRFF